MDSRHPRIALFTDSFHEVNGVALTSRQFEAYAQRHGLPMFSCHAGPANASWSQGSITRFEWTRSPAALQLEADLAFDLAALRHLARIRAALREFRPSLIHITSPGDCGLLGTLLARELKIPVAASWHTNIHQFGARRLERLLGFVSPRMRQTIGQRVEHGILDLTMLFYRLAKVLFAPNRELLHLLETRLQRPCTLMSRGIDTALFTPARRRRTDSTFRIGYVGRLSTEKNLEVFEGFEQALLANGYSDFEIVFVGHGSVRQRLEAQLRHARFSGVLKGEQLADEYANFDAFVFPSRTDTFGNVVLEALASGVPAIVADSGGPRFLVRHGETGFVAEDPSEMVSRTCELIANDHKRRCMGWAAREYAVSHHTWDSVFDAVYSGYDSFLSGKQYDRAGEVHAVPNC